MNNKTKLWCCCYCRRHEKCFSKAFSYSLAERKNNPVGLGQPEQLQVGNVLWGLRHWPEHLRIWVWLPDPWIELCLVWVLSSCWIPGLFSYISASQTYTCTQITRNLIKMWFWFRRSRAGARLCISNKLPGKTDAASPRATLWVARSHNQRHCCYHPITHPCIKCSLCGKYLEKRFPAIMFTNFLCNPVRQACIT